MSNISHAKCSGDPGFLKGEGGGILHMHIHFPMGHRPSLAKSSLKGGHVPEMPPPLDPPMKWCKLYAFLVCNTPNNVINIFTGSSNHQKTLRLSMLSPTSSHGAANRGKLVRSGEVAPMGHLRCVYQLSLLKDRIENSDMW